MSEETTAAPNGELFKALAQLQADLPKVGKAATAQYGKYADLADVSRTVLPLLGRHGLAFMARPTMVEGNFVLAYSLVHVSGGREDGQYPLPANGTSQQLGSAITYARRYALCAVTGVAPDEDDDGAAANATPWQGRPAADSWENARPRQNGQRSQQQRQAPQAAQPEEPPADAEPDIDAQAYADEAHGAITPHDIEDIHRRAREDGKLNALVRNPSKEGGRPGKLALYLDWKRKQIKELDDALAELMTVTQDAGVTDVAGWFRTVMDADLEGATPGQLKTATKTLREKAAA